MPLAQRLLEHLEATGLVSAADLFRIRAAIDVTGKRPDEVVLELGILEESRLDEILTGFGVLPADQSPMLVLPELSAEFLLGAKVLPLKLTDNELYLGMVNAWDDFTAKAVGLKLHRTVVRLQIDEARLDELRLADSGELRDEDRLAMGPNFDNSSDLELLKDAASDAPVVRFVSETLRRAVSQGASDIHLRALKFGSQLLFRLDGELMEQPPPPSGMLGAVISRLKIMANLDISERRLPQDGRLRANVAGAPVDFRISTMPHIHGEGLVLRILAREVAASRFEDLGFSAEILAGLQTLFSKAEGLILVTGPTGSGKSTTLHVALKQMMRPGQNVVTVEDPIEYRIEGASQVQVDDKIGLTFPRVLRSLLRQDPDVVLIGEIRDSETARIAVQAALTGHVVLATLHTNSAVAAIPRLIDMGVEPYLLAAVLRGVLAQRLVRRRCSNCAGEITSSSCKACGGTGRTGRLAIGELLTLHEELTSQLASSAHLDEAMMQRLRQQQYRPISEDAARRVATGEVAAEDLIGAVNGEW